MRALGSEYLRSCFFLKWCPIFVTSPLYQFSEFNNFLWVCWFLVKINQIFYTPHENSTTCTTIVSLQCICRESCKCKKRVHLKTFQGRPASTGSANSNWWIWDEHFSMLKFLEYWVVEILCKSIQCRYIHILLIAILVTFLQK